jgi:hypothetical protein
MKTIESLALSAFLDNPAHAPELLAANALLTLAPDRDLGTLVLGAGEGVLAPVVDDEGGIMGWSGELQPSDGISTPVHIDAAPSLLVAAVLLRTRAAAAVFARSAAAIGLSARNPEPDPSGDGLTQWARLDWHRLRGAAPWGAPDPAPGNVVPFRVPVE